MKENSPGFGALLKPVLGDQEGKAQPQRVLSQTIVEFEVPDFLKLFVTLGAVRGPDGKIRRLHFTQFYQAISMGRRRIVSPSRPSTRQSSVICLCAPTLFT
jgi:hypothetical protein